MEADEGPQEERQAGARERPRPKLPRPPACWQVRRQPGTHRQHFDCHRLRSVAHGFEHLWVGRGEGVVGVGEVSYIAGTRVEDEVHEGTQVPMQGHPSGMEMACAASCRTSGMRTLPNPPHPSSQSVPSARFMY